ncbi:MAG: TRL-like family protein [Kiritimatiellales bacterium]
MKKLFGLFILAALFTGCATQMPIGIIHTDNTLPLQVGDASAKCNKVGTATSRSYLALIAVGDSSINAAARDGGITKINHADWKVKNILGFVGEYTTTVYGE